MGTAPSTEAGGSHLYYSQSSGASTAGNASSGGDSSQFGDDATIRSRGSQGGSSADATNSSDYTHNYNNQNDALSLYIAKDFPYHVLESRLGPGSGRIMSTYRIRHVDSGSVFVLKAMLLDLSGGGNGGTPPSKEQITSQDTELKRILSLLAPSNSMNNASPYQVWWSNAFRLTTSAATMTPPNNYCPIYLLRPHFYSTLSDRIATRPFLSHAEKNWIAFGIISAVQQIHDLGVVHGHLTPANIGLTSWNWVSILDILPHSASASKAGRPIVLMDDDPSDWIQHFQEQEMGNLVGGNGTKTSFTQKGASHSSVKRCYLAPERFVARNKGSTSNTSEASTSSTGKDAVPGLTTNEETSRPTCLTPAMDIFSLGCVLMELYLNGEAALDLGDLMEYRKNKSISTHSALTQKLNKIESSSMRAAIRHMLHLDPSKRLSAGAYLERLMVVSPSKKLSTREKVVAVAPLPKSYQEVFFPLFSKVRSHAFSPDARIALAAIEYGKVIKASIGFQDEEGEAYFERMIGPWMINYRNSKDGQEEAKRSSEALAFQKQITEEHAFHEEFSTAELKSKRTTSTNKVIALDACNRDEKKEEDLLLAETEALLRQIEMDPLFTGVASSAADHKLNEINTKEAQEQKEGIETTLTQAGLRHLAQTPSAAALIIFVQFILSNVRHAERPSSKQVALQLLLRLAKFSTDQVRLQRIVPNIVSMLDDTDASVRAMSINVLTTILSMTESFPPSDAQIFPKYIFKRLSHLLVDPVLMVRISFVENLASLAETSMRFLYTCHVIKMYEVVNGDGNKSDKKNESDPIKKAMSSVESAFDDEAAKLLGSPVKKTATKGRSSTERKEDTENCQDDPISSVLMENTYDGDLLNLQEIVARWVITITTDTSEHASVINESLLKDIGRLCTFFGHDGVMTCILPQILAFLNNRKDWQLRAALCQHLSHVCAVVGRAATEQFVVPCVETALVDEEDLVINNALTCLGSLVEMGLLTRAVLLGKSGPDIRSRTIELQPKDKTISNPGIIQKYSALLIHPSECVRYAAAVFFSSCCRSMGFPDDEVFVLPLIRPFLRYDVERRRLLTPEGMITALVPYLTKGEFDQELSRPKWTAVRMENQPGTQNERVEVVPEVVSSLFEQIREYHSDEKLCSGYVDNLEAYLAMYRRNIHSRKKSSGDTKASMRVIDRDILGQQKAAFSCYLPNQKYAELLTKPLPVLYERMRQIASLDSSLESEISSLRCMPSLSSIYGLTIVQPTNSAQPQRRWKDGIAANSQPDTLNGILMQESCSGKKLHEYLSSDVSRIFGSAVTGEWGALSVLDRSRVDISQHVVKLVGLKVPTMPPRLGSLRDGKGNSYSCHGPVLASPHDKTDVRRPEWKPRVDVLTCSSPAHEHSGPITRLAVSQDQSFFVSAGHDGTSKVWETGQILNSPGHLKSCHTYNGHNTSTTSRSIRVNDLTVIENSHSIASASSDGCVHVWRVDTDSKQSTNMGNASFNSSSRVFGSTMLRKIDANEGEILSISHFNSPNASLVTFATQSGLIHSWDLRCAHEPFKLSLNPEFGYLTSMAVGNDQNWITAGSNRGYLALWDIRFQKLVKVWQHSCESSINRLGTSSARPYVVMGCGTNEASIFDISEGTCRQAMRVVDDNFSYLHQAALPPRCTSIPILKDVSIPSTLKRRHGVIDAIISSRKAPPQPNIQSFTGRVGTSTEYLITGGSDGHIRFWDFSSPSKCFTISGLAATEPRPVYERAGGNGSIFLCRTMPEPKIKEMNGAQITKRMQNGPLRPDNRHQDAILDLKKIDYPMKGLLSCSRDGLIKFWR